MGWTALTATGLMETEINGSLKQLATALTQQMAWGKGIFFLQLPQSGAL